MSNIETSIKSYALLCKRTPFLTVKNILDDIRLQNLNNLNGELHHVKNLYNQVGGDVMIEIAENLCLDGGGNILSKLSEHVDKAKGHLTKGADALKKGIDKGIKKGTEIASQLGDTARQIQDAHQSLKKVAQDVHKTIKGEIDVRQGSVLQSIAQLNGSQNVSDLKSAKDEIVKLKQKYHEIITKLKRDVEVAKDAECKAIVRNLSDSL